MTGEREPWFAVKVGMPDSPKVIELPNDTARYGLIVMWARLKRQRPSGMFRSRGVAREMMGRFGRYLDDWISGGFLHVAPFTCDDRRCQKGFSAAPSGALVAHSWHVYQREHAARQADLRLRDSGSDALSDAVSDASGDVGSDNYSRALSPVTGQVSVLQDGEPVAQGGDEPLYRVLDWLVSRRASIDVGRPIGIELARLVDRTSPERVIAAFEEAEQQAEREGNSLIDGRQYVTAAQQIIAPLYPHRTRSKPKGLSSAADIATAVERV